MGWSWRPATVQPKLFTRTIRAKPAVTILRSRTIRLIFMLLTPACCCASFYNIPSSRSRASSGFIDIWHFENVADSVRNKKKKKKRWRISTIHTTESARAALLLHHHHRLDMGFCVSVQASFILYLLVVLFVYIRFFFLSFHFILVFVFLFFFHIYIFFVRPFVRIYTILYVYLATTAAKYNIFVLNPCTMKKLNSRKDLDSGQQRFITSR